jgi:hypothetical protein
MLQRLQQLLTAPLGRAAAVGTDRHEHNRLAWEHAPDAVLNQAAACLIAPATGLSQLLERALGHAGVMLQLQSLQITAISGFSSHAANEQSLGSATGMTLIVEMSVPSLEAAEWVKRLITQCDPEVHGSSVSDLSQSKHPDHPPVKGGRKASSSPGCTRC